MGRVSPTLCYKRGTEASESSDKGLQSSRHREGSLRKAEERIKGRARFEEIAFFF